MPLTFDEGGFVASSGKLPIGRINKRPDSGWFWAISAVKSNPPRQGTVESKEAAQKALRESWESWLKDAGLRQT